VTGPDRSSSRRLGAAAILVGAVLLHALLIVNGGSDPHKRFGFRPFNESDTWSAEIVRVTADGDRIAVDDGTWAYDWNEIVAVAKLSSPGRTRHANGGARATVDLLGRALDWLADNTPDDPDTRRYEATVTVVHNAGPSLRVELVGKDKDPTA
jgi:hypothetical protein